MEGDDIKLALFYGRRIEDPRQYLFLCEAVWTVKQVQDEDIKKGQLATKFWGRALDWYMKFMQVSTGHPKNTLVQIKTGLIEEFQKPKSES